MAVLIVYCGVAIPLEIGFEDDMVLSMCGSANSRQTRSDCPAYLAWFWTNLVVDLIFITDIVINLRTGYMVQGHFVDDDWLAAKHYLKSYFAFDVVGSFPLNLVILAVDDSDNSAAGGRANKMLRLLRMAKVTKLTRMFKLAKYLEYFEVVVNFNPGLLRIFKLCLIIVLCCHWFGCGWWFVSDLEMHDVIDGSPWEAGENEWHPPLWLKYQSDFGIKYWHAFFWGAGMCLGMVPRDIEPVTSLEAILTTFAMFIGLMLAAFVISSMTTAFASIDSKKALAGKQLDVIRNYLLVKAVPNDLRTRILEYYQYIFTSSQSTGELRMLQHMPANLATQLALSINAKLIAKCAFFHEVSNASLAALVSTLEPLVFVPGQLMCTEGQPLSTIFFINRGRVQLLNHVGTEKEVVVRLLQDNDNFGLDDFSKSTDRRWSTSARSLTYCGGTSELGG